MSYKRLTTISEITNSPTLIALCESCGESGCNDICEEYQDELCTGCPVQEAFERLSCFEDSGLSPEENTELAKAKAEGRLLILPVPIGGTIYVPYKYKDIDGTIEAGIEEAKLSGYVKEGDREFYTTYDELGTNDYDPRDIFLIRENAEKALEGMVPDKPWCYRDNDDPYPLCVGRGMSDCQDCCLYENMKGPYDE